LAYRQDLTRLYVRLERVADLEPMAITAFAGQLGLVEATPSLENFEHGWQSIGEN
jgi:hypothetical protein